MITLVKNKGQVKALAGTCKYLLHTKVCGYDMYAKPGIKPIVGHIKWIWYSNRILKRLKTLIEF